MALRWLQRIELVLLAAAFLCGSVAAAALTRTQGSFGGSCPLYGVAALNGSSLVLSHPSAPSLCYFVAGASGLLALYCLLLLFFWVYSSCIEDSHRGSLGLRIALAISAIAIFLILVSACILRFGTSSLCNSIISLNHTISCSEAQKISWTPPGIAVQFYSNLQNAEVRQRDILRLNICNTCLPVMDLSPDSGETGYFVGRPGLEMASFLTLLFPLTDLFLGESGTVVSGLDAPGRAVQV